MNKTKCILLAGALLLSACGDPEKAAQRTIDEVQANLQKEQVDYDPQHRLDAYESMINEVESIAKEAKTSVGRTIAAGQSVNGVSLAGLQRLHDALAPRAGCYADPTVDCLAPFGSSATNGRAAASPENAFADAEKLVCDKGFSSADKALDPFKINKQAYAKELIQVALSATQCDNPGEVKAAIDAYLKATPEQSGERLSGLLSILNTPALKPAWGIVTGELEAGLKSGAIGGQDAANVTLTLALNYANSGDTKSALEKFTYFTDTLHYKADASSQQQLAAAVIANGDVDAGLKIQPYASNPNMDATMRPLMLHQGAAVLASRMGLVDTGISALPDGLLGNQSRYKNIDDYFTPVDARAKSQYEAAVTAIEAAVDNLASTAKPTAQTVGGIGLDSTYGLIAVIHQKLGEPDKADAAIKKAVDLRIRLLGRADAQDFTAIAKFATLIAIAHDDLPTAANYIKTAQLFTDTYGRLLMVQVGRTQNAEAALEIANTISGRRDLWHAYSDMIPEMAKAGKQGEIDKLINAWSGDPRQKSNFYWPIINGMIDNGDVAGARKFADKYHLADDDNGKLRLDSQLLSSEKIAKNRSQAGPIIREMFTIGEAKDVAANTKDSAVMYDRGKSYSAQHAAELAFQNGYTDLGIELYQKATNKDHRPLLYAFSDEISKSDMTTVLMLAQYNATSPAYLSYVIDSAIRHLKKTQG